MDSAQLLNEFSRERPVGTPANNQVSAMFTNLAEAMGYDVTALPFSCKTWSHGESSLITDSLVMPILTGPFSSAFSGTGELAFVETAARLRHADLTGKIAVLKGEIASEPIMPKDYLRCAPRQDQKLAI